MRMVVFSLALICIILFRREGFMGKREFNWDWVSATFRKQGGPPCQLTRFWKPRT